MKVHALEKEYKTEQIIVDHSKEGKLYGIAENRGRQDIVEKKSRKNFIK
jgi:hypothetical protein